jgi:hypothetical protein
MAAFVDPPRAAQTAAALWNAASESHAEGFRSHQTMSTIRRPASNASRIPSASTAGTDETPGRENPSTSARAVIVEAVPMSLQVPTVGAQVCSTSRNSSNEMLPTMSSWPYCHPADDEPSFSPRHEPLSMKPAGT